jgi:hypothetical protein
MRVQLLHHSYERYEVPGDRKSLKEYRQGDVFDAVGAELERLMDLQAVQEAKPGDTSKVAERARAEYDLAVKRHDNAVAEHEQIASEPHVAAQTVDRSKMNVEALRGERERLGRLVRRYDEAKAESDPPADPDAAAKAAAEAAARAKSGAK